jgi:hypothetical protein
MGVDRGNCECGILTDVRVSVGQTLTGGFCVELMRCLDGNAHGNTHAEAVQPVRHLVVCICIASQIQLLQGATSETYRNRRVFPRTYSLGACRSNRMALLSGC